MRNCNVCMSPHMDVVNAALASGRSPEATAKEFGFSKAGVARHKKHMHEPPRRPKEKAPKAPKPPKEPYKYGTVDPVCLRVLGKLDPGFEGQHRRILGACASLTSQRTTVRDVLVMALFQRATQTPWALAAGRELAKLLGERATW